MPESDKAEKELGRLRRLPENRVCPNCLKEDSLGFHAVCMPYKTFICGDCKSAHQSFSHRTKSVTQSIWTMEEVKVLDPKRGGGNKAARAHWLAKVPEAERPTADSSLDKFKQFIERAYIDQRWVGSEADVSVESGGGSGASEGRPRSVRSRTASSVSGAATAAEDQDAIERRERRHREKEEKEERRRERRERRAQSGATDASWSQPSCTPPISPEVSAAWAGGGDSWPGACPLQGAFPVNGNAAYGGGAVASPDDQYAAAMGGNPHWCMPQGGAVPSAPYASASGGAYDNGYRVAAHAMEAVISRPQAGAWWFNGPNGARAGPQALGPEPAHPAVEHGAVGGYADSSSAGFAGQLQPNYHIRSAPSFPAAHEDARTNPWAQQADPIVELFRRAAAGAAAGAQPAPPKHLSTAPPQPCALAAALATNPWGAELARWGESVQPHGRARVQ